MNKKGFTLIELLAVIIILGILMIIAIPSVTKYISDSRKSAYIGTAKQVASGVRNFVNEGTLGMYDSSTTYYIPVEAVKTENALKSPYGVFTKAYVGVIYDGQGYKYYWISVDDAGQGFPNIKPLDKLDIDDIESDLNDAIITNVIEHTAIGDRTRIAIYNPVNNEWVEPAGEIEKYISEEYGGGVTTNIVCIPAKRLHSTTCSRTDNKGCNEDGLVGNGSNITYGTLASGTPKPGDAYDCKLTQDGDYTERFYYVGNSGSNSILIYYKNYSNKVAYDSNNENWHGPTNAYQFLPSTSDWDNPGLIATGSRQILAERGETSTTGGTLPIFPYTNKAARFLTFQEISSACGSTGLISTGYLKKCPWLAENAQYAESTGSFGYWLENTYSANDYQAWVLTGYSSRIGYTNTNNTLYYGIRPVITIKRTDLG